jgi:hypothetical protein
MIARVQSAMAAAATASILVVAGLAGCSSGSSQAPTFGVDPYTTVQSDSNALSVEMRTAPQPPERGTIEVEFRIRSVADGSLVDGLTVTVAPWMPAPYNHGPSVAPKVVAEGQGRYLVTGVDLFMPGPWELKTTLSGPVADNVAPAFDVP